jgi:hypothetical protein
MFPVPEILLFEFNRTPELIIAARSLPRIERPRCFSGLEERFFELQLSGFVGSSIGGNPLIKAGKEIVEQITC